jgi:hypothetical protein
MLNNIKKRLEEYGDATIFVKDEERVYFNEAYISDNFKIQSGYFELEDCKNIGADELDCLLSESVNAIVLTEDDYDGTHYNMLKSFHNLNFNSLENLTLSEAVEIMKDSNVRELAFLPKY